MNLRLPPLSGNEAQQLQQIRSFLHQLVDELNYSLDTMRGGNAAVTQAAAQAMAAGGKDSPQATFNSIKALIIKSADIINAYTDAISKRLEGLYVAQSDFGTFVEETNNAIEANSTGIEQIYSSLQSVITDLEGVENALIEVNASIKTGVLYYDENGVPVYGLEIGQRTEVDGTEVFNKFARFTSDRLAFFDQNDNEVAYISDKQLVITHVWVKGSWKMGGFTDTVRSDGSIVTKWTGV